MTILFMKNKCQDVFNSAKKIDGYNIFFALLSGFLLFLSFPKFGLGFIAWIAFVPLFIALRDVVSIRQAIWLGLVTGITAHVGMIYWIAYVVVHYGHLPFYRGVFIMLLLACYLSLYVAIFAAGIVFLREKIALYLTAPVLWICLEYGKSYLFTGFPWENLGYSQYSYYFLIQIADIAGVYGLSFLVMLLNATIYEIMTEKSRKTIVLTIAVFLLWMGVYTYGIARIAQISRIQDAAPGMDVSLIQGNIDQSIKWNEHYQKETIDIYEDLSLRHPVSKERLLVWPETAVPFDYQDESNLKRRVEEIARKSKSWFIFGSMSYEMNESRKDYYNSAYLLSPEGKVHGRYDKVHLVPYGEYVPLRKIFPFITALAADIGDFSTGTGFLPVNIGGKKIGVLICYEGILAEAARSYKNASAELLVNITNDAWFGTSSAPYQHFSMSIFRAIETRLYFVRAANTGISAIVDPTGRIIRRTDLFKKDEISGNIKFMNTTTVYAKSGNWLVYASFAVLAAFFLTGMKGRIKNDG